MSQTQHVIEDFVCYAPSFLEDSTHFPKESFKELYELEKGHFWFESRNKIIIHFLKRYLSFLSRPQILEVGCGTGFVLEGLAKSNPNYELSGTEIYLEGLRFAKSRSPHISFFQSDARNLPFKEKYDAICAFDVVEHIEEDIDTLNSFYQSLKPGGFLFLSVPQHMWLWSHQDEMACHKRRYTRREMAKKLTSCGFTIKKTTSFVFTLLPLMYISRSKKKKDSTLDEFKISKLLNKLLAYTMKLDEALVKLGFSLPVGGSLFCVAKKV
jgi:2-polyprenyl-3-methyl-5-hydroxy-6-metoxy-1,4-benzoquinol methylase